MFSHVTVGVRDLDRALAFYRPLMEALGQVEKFATRRAPGPWAGFMTEGVARPLFIVMQPYDRQPASAGNGAMVAFMAKDRAQVDAVHALALELGGRDEGAPGHRPHYHDGYYGAYFRDPDGNKFCVVDHGTEEISAP